MFVMISPLQGHLSETLTSLKFATKVRCKTGLVLERRLTVWIRYTIHISGQRGGRRKCETRESRVRLTRAVDAGTGGCFEGGVIILVELGMQLD